MDLQGWLSSNPNDSQANFVFINCYHYPWCSPIQCSTTCIHTTIIILLLWYPYVLHYQNSIYNESPGLSSQSNKIIMCNDKFICTFSVQFWIMGGPIEFLVISSIVNHYFDSRNEKKTHSWSMKANWKLRTRYNFFWLS